MDEKVISETYGSSDQEWRYLLSEDRLIKISKPKQHSLDSLSTFFTQVFLPQGYPSSVSADYLEYQIWDTIQAFCSSITSSLATQAVLKGVGVGDETATVAAATMTWLLKDGTGMIGRITFAWLRGSELDWNCKRWRMFADVLNDISIFLNILAPYFSNIFRTIVCVSGVLKAMVGVAGGATRAAITQHQARRNNMADVAAKDSSQETLVNLMGLIVSLILIPLVSGNMLLVWTFFCIFTMVHLMANYKAVTCLVIDMFNQPRLHIAASKYFTTGKCSVTKEANFAEPIFCDLKRIFTIHLGCSLQRNMKKEMNVINCQRYLFGVSTKQNSINISLHVDSTPTDQLKSCFHAELIEFCFKCAKEGMQNWEPSTRHLIYLASKGHIPELLVESQKYMEANWATFVSAAENAGWKISSNSMGADEWRMR